MWWARLRAVFDGPGRERGDENVSAVLIWPALLLILWVIFQIVLVTLGNSVALDAARAGLADGRLPPVDTASAYSAAISRAEGASIAGLSNIDATVSSDGSTVTVTVTAEASSIIPFATFSVTRTASGPIEQIEAVGP